MLTFDICVSFANVALTLAMCFWSCKRTYYQNIREAKLNEREQALDATERWLDAREVKLEHKVEVLGLVL